MAKALVLANPRVVEIFYQDLLANALLLVNPTEIEYWCHFTVVNIRWFLFVERLPDTSAERLSTVSSPYMLIQILLSGQGPSVGLYTKVKKTYAP